MSRSHRVITAGVTLFCCLSLSVAQPPTGKEPETNAALLAEIKRLKEQLQAKQPAAVSKWKLTGKIDGNKARLRVTFSIYTERDGTTVALGCSRGHVTDVQLDKETATPPLLPAREGLVLQVEKKGDHEATVDLIMLLGEMPTGGSPAPPRPGAVADSLVGFDLDLPLCLVTTVDLELPNDAKGVRANDQPAGELLNKNRLTGGLGKAGGLKVAWRPPHAMKGPVPVLTAKGWITARLATEKSANDEVKAELVLQDRGRSAQEWVLQIPRGARVRLANTSDRERLKTDIPSSASADGRVVIALAAPSPEPLPIIVSYARPRSSTPLPLGPFNVEGAITQEGIIWVVAAGDQRVRCLPWQQTKPSFSAPPRSLEERPSSDTRDTPPHGATAAFQYRSLASSDRIDLNDPWFKLDTDTVLGQLETSIDHTLTLENGAGRQQWRLRSTFKAQSRRTEVDRLELDWPTPWLLDRERSPRPRGVASVLEENLTNRRLRLQLDSDALKPFELTLEAQVNESQLRGDAFSGVPESSYPSAVIRLPKPRSGMVFDAGNHTITINVPPTIDLRVPQPANSQLELFEKKAHSIVWKAERLTALEQIAIAWKAYQPEMRVDSIIDATLTGEQAEIRHRLRFVFEDKYAAPTNEVELMVPSPVSNLAVISGGKLIEPTARATDRALRRISLTPRRTGETEAEVVLRYWTNRSDSGMPMLSAVGATQGRMRVRAWAPGGKRVRTTQETWKEQRLEIVEDRDRLPSLVLETEGPAQPLTLRLEDDATDGERAVLVEQVLVQVQIAEGGFQKHRVRFLLRQLTTEQIDLEFPGSVDALNVQAALDGARLNWKLLQTREFTEGERKLSSRIQLRLPIGRLQKPAALEVTYNVPPSRSGFLGALQSTLEPVSMPGLPAGVPVCWQIDLPGSAVPLSLDPADGSWRWGRRGWLLAPQPPMNAGEVERWFWGEGDSRGTAMTEEEANLVPGFVGWRGSLGPLTLYHVPQQGWLLVCSLIVLILGLALGQAALRSPSAERKRGRLFWPLLIAMALGVGIAGLIWPGVVSAFVYGAQPGLVVVLVVLGVQWLLHERYRRSVVFLPSFRRVKSGSSLARATRPEKTSSGAARGDGLPALAGSQPGTRPSTGSGPKRAEPSTVDAPADEANPP